MKTYKQISKDIERCCNEVLKLKSKEDSRFRISKNRDKEVKDIIERHKMNEELIREILRL